MNLHATPLIPRLAASRSILNLTFGTRPELEILPPNTSNLAFASPLVQNQPSMGSRLPHELLEELKSYLQHFDQTGHLVETDAVAEIKRRLCQRIAEVEALVRMTQSNGVMKDTTYRPGQGAR